jgi:hypothetical protein
MFLVSPFLFTKFVLKTPDDPVALLFCIGKRLFRSHPVKRESRGVPINAAKNLFRVYNQRDPFSIHHKSQEQRGIE